MSDRLTALDSSFLHLEDAATHMHVAGVSIFEGPSPDYRDLLDHIERRLALVPRFRQKLRFVPLNQGRPVWVDDPHFNLEYHVRVTALPPPGTEEQLKRLAGRVFSQQLDRTKPLWEIWLVQGLQRTGGSPDEAERFALLSKTHHCLVDGIAGVDITTVLFDTSPEPEAPPAAGPTWTPRPEPSGTQLLTEALLERATQPAEVVRSARAAIRAPRLIGGRVTDALAAIGALAKAGLGAPSSSLNVEIGPHRRFDWVRTDLKLLKQVKNELGGTLNDTVLTIVTGGLRRFLEGRGEIVDGLELRAMVPVSVRPSDERGMTGNKVAAMMAPLPVYEADPLERLEIVRGIMAGLKSSRQAVGAEVLTQLSGFAPQTVMAQAARLQARQRFFNLVVTNVPGPQIPLYVLGRELLDVFPMAPLAKRQSLCVAVMSYNGKMNFGLLGDYDAMPDLQEFVDSIEQAIDELRRAAGIKPGRIKAKPKPEREKATSPAASTSNGKPESASLSE